MAWKYILIIATLVNATLVVPRAQAGMMYWSDTSARRIQRASTDGGTVEDVITTDLINPRGVALDGQNENLYWTDEGNGQIRRSDLDGEHVEILIASGLRCPFFIALDVDGGKMYWTADWTPRRVQRANLDGTQIEDLVSLQDPQGLALDLAGQKMYWFDNIADKMQRANLDGSAVEDLNTSLDLPRAVALDSSAGKLYWAEQATSKIQRSNLDGTMTQDIVSVPSAGPYGLALDIETGRMYWTESYAGRIVRAPMDGGPVESLVTGLGYPCAIALLASDCAPPRIASHPASVSVCAGTSVNLSLEATGSGALNFQWRRDGVGIAGATESTFHMDSATEADAATYDVVISNACGTIVSDAAVLLVWPLGTGDTNGDSSVDGLDIPVLVQVILAQDSGEADLASCAADMNADGVVNQSDLGPFLDRLVGP